MSDYKKESAERRDFRHTHAESEIAKHKGKKKRKCWKLTAEGNICLWKDRRMVLGKYATEKQAEEAMKQHKNSTWYSDFKVERV